MGEPDRDGFWEDVRGYSAAAMTGLLSRPLMEKTLASPGGKVAFMDSRELGGRALEYGMVMANLLKITRKRMEAGDATQDKGTGMVGESPEGGAREGEAVRGVRDDTPAQVGPHNPAGVGGEEVKGGDTALRVVPGGREGV